MSAHGSIVWSDEMRAEWTRYEVPGWGEGELWTGADIVFASDFRFLDCAGHDAANDTALRAAPAVLRTAPLEGGVNPPFSTVASPRARVGNSSVNTLRRPTGTQADSRAFAADLADRLSAFLRGEAVAFGDVPLELSSSTPFERAVITVLREIPRGDVVTYAELAALAGHPGAQRAAGTICARNRFIFLLPCHRVVASSGIGGYGASGVAVKRRLLALEGVTL